MGELAYTSIHMYVPGLQWLKMPVFLFFWSLNKKWSFIGWSVKYTSIGSELDLKRFNWSILRSLDNRYICIIIHSVHVLILSQPSWVLICPFKFRSWSLLWCYTMLSTFVDIKLTGYRLLTRLLYYVLVIIKACEISCDFNACYAK